MQGSEAASAALAAGDPAVETALAALVGTCCAVLTGADGYEVVPMSQTDAATRRAADVLPAAAAALMRLSAMRAVHAAGACWPSFAVYLPALLGYACHIAILRPDRSLFK